MSLQRSASISNLGAAKPTPLPRSQSFSPAPPVPPSGQGILATARAVSRVVIQGQKITASIVARDGSIRKYEIELIDSTTNKAIPVNAETLKKVQDLAENMCDLLQPRAGGFRVAQIDFSTPDPSIKYDAEQPISFQALARRDPTVELTLGALKRDYSALSATIAKVKVNPQTDPAIAQRQTQLDRYKHEIRLDQNHCGPRSICHGLALQKGFRDHKTLHRYLLDKIDIVEPGFSSKKKHPENPTEDDCQKLLRLLAEKTLTSYADKLTFDSGRSSKEWESIVINELRADVDRYKQHMPAITIDGEMVDYNYLIKSLANLHKGDKLLPEEFKTLLKYRAKYWNHDTPNTELNFVRDDFFQWSAIGLGVKVAAVVRDQAEIMSVFGLPDVSKEPHPNDTIFVYHRGQNGNHFNSFNNPEGVYNLLIQTHRDKAIDTFMDTFIHPDKGLKTQVPVAVAHTSKLELMDKYYRAYEALKSLILEKGEDTAENMIKCIQDGHITSQKIKERIEALASAKSAASASSSSGAAAHPAPASSSPPAAAAKPAATSSSSSSPAAAPKPAPPSIPRTAAKPAATSPASSSPAAAPVPSAQVAAPASRAQTASHVFQDSPSSSPCPSPSPSPSPSPTSSSPTVFNFPAAASSSSSAADATS